MGSSTLQQTSASGVFIVEDDPDWLPAANGCKPLRDVLGAKACPLSTVLSIDYLSALWAEALIIKHVLQHLSMFCRLDVQSPTSDISSSDTTF